MISFIKELAVYCWKEKCINDCTRLQAEEMYKIAEKYQKAADLVYLMQYNYECACSCKELAILLINNLK